MDKAYNHKEVEEKIYKMWEEKEYFKPEVNPKGKSYCIILPPPNANAPLHFGHAMYSIEDILIRYHRMKGEASLWVPGADHAGFETQFVFEKHLAKEGKSRFDYDRETLYKKIWDFVQNNRPIMENQLRRLGFSLDWGRKKFTLDPDIIKILHKTFKKLYDDGLIYRSYKLVNYCTKDGTSFSDLEVVYEERKDPLYYIKYGPLVLATTRPETKFGDTAVAVNPNDKRYKKYIGKKIEIETVLGKANIKVIADLSVDPEFGTGVVKITPAHDFNDFEVGQRHNLELKQVIGFDGRLNEKAGKFAGMKVAAARKAVVEEMQKKGLIEKIDQNYTHRIGLCYKCKTVIEPLPLEQWFVKMKPLAKKAIENVKDRRIKIYPQSFENRYFQFLENIRDWNISRQIVWGIRIPAWRCAQCVQTTSVILGSEATPESKKEIDPGQARLAGASAKRARMTTDVWIVTDGNKPEKCSKCGSKDLKQDTDVFDTWFSSSQWPFATLMTNCDCNDSNGFFDKFYPTSVMETGYEILPWWVARMIMIGDYATGKIPFRDIVLHGMVRDPMGQKMSKSKGNVVNPIEVIDQYGADAVRFALIYGTALGTDQALSYPKLESARRFTNKLWNIGRFIEMQKSKIDPGQVHSTVSSGRTARMTSFWQARNERVQNLGTFAKHKTDKEWISKVDVLSKEVTSYLDSYQFNFAAEKLYEFIWHEFADKYIEDVKERIDDNSYLILNSLFIILLKLLHPMMPFVTEEIYQRLEGEGSIMISSWPK